MYAIVSFLDKKYNQKVQEIWSMLEAELNVKSDYIDPIPHFSYSVAEKYDLDYLKDILAKFVEKSGKFKIRTNNSLGIFVAPKIVVYIPLIRNLKISYFHRKLWKEINKNAEGVVQYYHPERWSPHITLAANGLTQQNLPEAIKLLSQYDFDWEFSVNTISIICEDCEFQEEKHNFHLGTCFKTIAEVEL